MLRHAFRFVNTVICGGRSQRPWSVQNPPDCRARAALSGAGVSTAGAAIRVGPPRAEHLAAARISAADVEILLDALAMVIEPVRISYLWRPVLPDAGDDLVLETAVNGRAEILVTFNRRHFEPAAHPLDSKSWRRPMPCNDWRTARPFPSAAERPVRREMACYDAAEGSAGTRRKR
jgi:hypothetical protein